MSYQVNDTQIRHFIEPTTTTYVKYKRSKTKSFFFQNYSDEHIFESYYGCI